MPVTVKLLCHLRKYPMYKEMHQHRVVRTSLNDTGQYLDEEMKYPQDGVELLKLFGDIEGAGYVDAVILNDVKAGFSVQHRYPEDIRFKPAKTESGKDDSIACIWVVYESEKQRNSSLVPIRFRIALMSKYRARHGFEEDDQDKEKPTKVSVELSRSSPQPFDLNLKDGYFFDLHTGTIVDDKGNTVAGVVALDEIFEAHCNSVHPVKGLGIRSKQAAHSFSRSALDKLIDGGKWFLKNVFGRTLNERTDRSSYFDGYQLQDFGKLSEDCIELFGYKTPKSVLAVFVLVAIGITYSLHPISEHSYPDLVVHSEVLMTIHCLACLMVLDVAVPRMIFRIVNGLICFRRRYVNWMLKSL